MRRTIATLALAAMLLVAGCAGPETSDYQDAPDEIQDGSLDYQDYKEANCPYLEGSLDHETMEKCNDWIRENNVTVN